MGDCTLVGLNLCRYSHLRTRDAPFLALHAPCMVWWGRSNSPKTLNIVIHVIMLRERCSKHLGLKVTWMMSKMDNCHIKMNLISKVRSTTLQNVIHIFYFDLKKQVSLWSFVLRISVYVWQISCDVQPQIQSVTWRFQKQKWMSIDIYILF